MKSQDVEPHTVVGPVPFYQESFFAGPRMVGQGTIAPSAVPFGGNLPKAPQEMSVQDIARIQAAFVAAAQRSLAAGFEWLELHFAHGYLAHQFYSPPANHRTDAYGGSFDNRIRFLLETLAAVRKVWPERLPLTARLSVTDWIEGGVTVEESIELVRRLKCAGLDLLDVSQGFLYGTAWLTPLRSRRVVATERPRTIRLTQRRLLPSQGSSAAAHGMQDWLRSRSNRPTLPT